MSAGEALRDAVAAAAGAPVVAMAVVHGGDVAAAFRVDLADGRRVFAKTHPTAPPGFFTTEAGGLQWLRDAGAVAVPAVLAVADEPLAMLVLEWIDVGGRAGATEDELGRSLARLHDAGAPCFGREDRRTTGSRPCRTSRSRRGRRSTRRTACCRWPAWRATGGRCRRQRSPGWSAWPARSTASTTGRRRPGCTATCGPATAWSAPTARSWLIDPAAHGGHREFDLAMMRLFGGFGTACFTAYEEIHPLSAGWADRIELHQIAPLVVHAVKFGGSYGPAAERAIARYA